MPDPLPCGNFPAKPQKPVQTMEGHSSLCVLSQVLSASAHDTLLVSYDSTAPHFSEALEAELNLKGSR